MQSGMLWETWQHGPGTLPQYCPGPSPRPFSFTVAAVAVPDAAGWYVNRDHSKWGVTSGHAPDCCLAEVLILTHALRPSMCGSCGAVSTASSFYKTRWSSTCFSQLCQCLQVLGLRHILLLRSALAGFLHSSSDIDA